MPNPVAGLLIGGTTLASGALQAGAARDAAGTQARAAAAGMGEQRRQFDIATEILEPYVAAGLPAIEQLQALSGTLGQSSQQQAIDAIEQGAEFQAMTRQGEDAILQNAAATGGLRGGNTQSALAQFRPQVLSNLINQQYGRLGGLTEIGQASAARQAAQSTQFGQNIAQGYSDMGAAQAGGTLGAAKAWGDALGGIGQAAGYLAGKGVF